MPKHAVPSDINKAVTELGIVIEREDDQEITALCPFHEQRTGKADSKPSWAVNKDTGFHNCFSCGYGGTFIDLVMDLECPFDVWGARQWIRKYGIRLVDPDELPSWFDPIEVKKVREKEFVGEARLSLFYRPPRDQLRERGISRDAADVYDVLWDIKNSWIPNGRRKPGPGWIFPVRSEDSELQGWQFKNKKTFINYPDNLPKSEALYGYELLEPGKIALLVESPPDCPHIWDAGLEDVVAVSSYGVGVSDEQLRMILRRTDRIMLGLDNDEDGRFHTCRIARGGINSRGQPYNGWITRFAEMTVFNYNGCKEKDEGEMSLDAITTGVATAFSASRLEPVKERQERDVPGRPKALPRDGRRQGARQAQAARRVRNGAREDRHQHLRRRRTG